MDSFPLENEEDAIEKEKEELEKEKEKEEMEEIKKKADSTSHLPSAKIPYIERIPIIIGGLIFIVVLLNMIVLFAVPYQKIQTNKRKLPNAHFEKPKIYVIVVHFVLHFWMLLIGILIILLGFRGYKYISYRCVRYTIIHMVPIIVAFWLIIIIIELCSIPCIYQEKTIEQLTSSLNSNPPINFAFIYTKCLQSGDFNSYNTYYSKNGIIFPMKTNNTSPIYNFTDAPEFFYLVIDQKVNMSSELRIYFNEIFVDARGCDDGELKVDFYPKIKGDYTVLKGKMPTYLNKATRITSILFGVGVYYELYFKSIPYITYVQYSNADLVQGVNYNQIFTSDTCEDYGKCSHSDKPKPNL